nr:response regulator [Desulfobulbaceae bacterium]
MNFLQRFKIRTKLLANSVLMLSLLVAVIVTYQVSQKRADVFFKQVLEEEHDVVDRAATIKTLINECRKNEINFLLHNKLIYSAQVNRGIDEINNQSAKISSYVEKTGDFEIQDMLEVISRSLKVYEQTFNKIVEGRKKQGLTHDEGLQGKFREIAQMLFDEHITEHAVEELLLSVGRLNRYSLEIDHKNSAQPFKTELERFDELLKAHPMRPIYADKLTRLSTAYTEEAATFLETAEQRDVHEGHRKALHRIGLEMEGILSSMYVPNVRSMVLQIRRHEKDYLLRENLLYVQKSHQAVADLRQAIETANVNYDDVSETVEYLKSYQTYFDALVEENRKINLLKNSLLDRAMEIEQAVDHIVEKSRVNGQDNMNKAQAQVNSAYVFVLIFSFMAIVIGVLFSLLITNSITRPLQTLMAGLLRMADGDYSVRLAENTSSSDETSVVAKLFNKMAATIHKSSWQTEGIAKLAEELREDKEEDVLCRDIISFLAKFIDAQVGAMYVRQNDTTFRLAESYSYVDHDNPPVTVKIGEGLIGEAARGGELLVLSDLPDTYFRIKSSLGEAIPRHSIVLPALWRRTTQAVIELASIKSFSAEQIEFLKLISESIAIAIHSMQQRARTLELLQETQQQAEELQTQHEELKTSNEELEEQTQCLRQSEEELKSQQEELQATNEELEEKTQALEHKNLQINETNKDLEIAWNEIDGKSKEIIAASRYKSEFLANMSHELRTPLNSLLLLARDLVKNKKGNLDSDQVQSANIIYNSGEDLLKLINDILDLSKIESGHMEASHETFGIRGFADWLNDNFRHMAADKGLDFTVGIENGLPKIIVTDRQRLEQIVRNLVANAIKFTAKGGVTVTFKPADAESKFSESSLDPNFTMAISVTDTGIGVTPEQQTIIFDAFKQAEGGTSRKYGGTGLGLSISSKLATLLGGEIQLISEEGKGATFTLFIPFMVDENDQNEIIETSDNSSREDQEFKSSATFERKDAHSLLSPDIPDDRQELSKHDKVILIIEDDLNFAKILMDLGREKGFKSMVSSTGFGGLDLAERYQPSAIILDIRLPDIDGWQVLDTLKTNASLRHIPVHMISGEEKHIEALKKGAMGFLLKPISQEGVEEVFDRLEDAMSARMRDLLVVEDDELMAQEIIELIGNDDINVIIAKSGQEALDVLSAKKIDCMILDIGLPDMTGFALLANLESMENVATPPVIIYTSRELTKEEGDSLLQYTDTVIIKGLKSEERLLNETSLFLHRVIRDMPTKKRQMIASLYDQDAMFKDKRVLIVDDDMRNAYALSKILDERGMSVHIAHDGQHALSLMAELEAVDLVLMDIMMPVMDGYETMQKIREQEAFRSLPIIALTAKAMAEDKSKCMEAGASDYLTKPIEEGRLLSMMRVWLYR